MAQETWRWRGVLWLVVIPGALLYPCLSFLLFEPDEGRYAEIPREMLIRGDWLVPHLQGEPYLDKPPLFYWLVMASYRVFGIHDWSARLVPALAIHACILAVYLLGRRWLGERAAFWGAMLLALAPGFVSMGRLLVLDGLLALWVSLSLFAVYEAVGSDRLRWGWWLAAGLTCGLGVMTKGPVAIALLVAPVLAYRRLAGPGWKLSWLPWIIFASCVMAVSLPWYVAVCLRQPEFARYFLWTHNVVRFLTPFDHQQPIWFYVPIVVGGLLPGSLLAWGCLKFLMTADPVQSRLRLPVIGYLILASSWCVFFFTLSGCKLPTYVLPAFPPLSLCLGYYAVHVWRPSRWCRPALAGTIALLAGAHYVGIPWYARFHSPMSRADRVSQYCSDHATPVVCYPRNCDSVAFYVGRDDFKSYRSKETSQLLQFLQEQPRTILLFTHRHSPDFLKTVLPRDMSLTHLMPMSRSWARTWRTEYCYIGVVEKLQSSR
jgi:4-amino-4-deoxy-L-arabinose transferase-like glycosyltransferase